MIIFRNKCLGILLGVALVVLSGCTTNGSQHSSAKPQSILRFKDTSSDKMDNPLSITIQAMYISTALTTELIAAMAEIDVQKRSNKMNDQFGNNMIKFIKGLTNENEAKTSGEQIAVLNRGSTDKTLGVKYLLRQKLIIDTIINAVYKGADKVKSANLLQPIISGFNMSLQAFADQVKDKMLPSLDMNLLNIIKNDWKRSKENLQQLDLIPLMQTKDNITNIDYLFSKI